MIKNEYLIHELAVRSGISPRTIRYYQQEGLLPEPYNRGKYAYYNNDHLDRLKLIHELKKNYLPLKEIREQLNSLTDEQVRSILESHKSGESRQKHPINLTTHQPGQSNSESALQYISQVLRTQPSFKEEVNQKQFTLSQNLAGNQRYVAGTQTENWQRIVLAPGIEIHIKEPLSPRDKKRLEELIMMSRKIFL